jgi:hypothetical protein
LGYYAPDAWKEAKEFLDMLKFINQRVREEVKAIPKEWKHFLRETRPRKKRKHAA